MAKRTTNQLTVERAAPPAKAPRLRHISSAVRALDVLADPWSYLILREAFFRVRRFDELQRNLQIARNVLAQRLKRLVAEGVLDRRQYQERPARFEYRLTPAGKDFYPAIVALMDWGDRWRPSPGGPPLILTHRCGKRLNLTVVCSHCRKAVSPFEVSFFDGPGAGFEPLGNVPATRRATNKDAYVRGRPCSVARTLQAIGDRWSFRILRESFVGVRRFEDLQRKLGTARNILTDRLNNLMADGLLKRRQYQTRPDRYEYVLTPAGLDLYPSLLLLLLWGDRWRPSSKGEPLILVHEACGARLQPILVCLSCGNAVLIQDVRYKMRYTYP